MRWTSEDVITYIVGVVGMFGVTLYVCKLLGLFDEIGVLASSMLSVIASGIGAWMLYREINKLKRESNHKIWDRNFDDVVITLLERAKADERVEDDLLHQAAGYLERIIAEAVLIKENKKSLKDYAKEDRLILEGMIVEQFRRFISELDSDEELQDYIA